MLKSLETPFIAHLYEAEGAKREARTPGPSHESTCVLTGRPGYSTSVCSLDQTSLAVAASGAGSGEEKTFFSLLVLLLLTFFWSLLQFWEPDSCLWWIRGSRELSFIPHHSDCSQLPLIATAAQTELTRFLGCIMGEMGHACLCCSFFPICLSVLSSEGNVIVTLSALYARCLVKMYTIPCVIACSVQELTTQKLQT